MGHQITTTDKMFSVRDMPWHYAQTRDRVAILDEPPKSIDEALEKSGLGWGVSQEPVFIRRMVPNPHGDQFPPTEMFVPLKDADDVEYMANIRSDNEAVLGVVTDDYKVVGNREAFEFMDALLGSDLYFETAGSLQGGKRVWVLAKVPEYIEVGGDPTAMYLYVANSHDGSMAVQAGATPIRIVCANTLGMTLRRSEYGEAAQRTFKFRHTGNLKLKFDEARKVMGMTLDYAQQFKVLGDKLALEPMSKGRFEDKVVKPLFTIEDDMGARAKGNRERATAKILDIFDGKGAQGDTTGNSPYSKWTAFNAVSEFADWERRYTKRTSQVQRSFEDGALKQRALDLVIAA